MIQLFSDFQRQPVLLQDLVMEHVPIHPCKGQATRQPLSMLHARLSASHLPMIEPVAAARPIVFRSSIYEDFDRRLRFEVTLNNIVHVDFISPDNTPGEHVAVAGTQGASSSGPARARSSPPAVNVPTQLPYEQSAETSGKSPPFKKNLLGQPTNSSVVHAITCSNRLKHIGIEEMKMQMTVKRSTFHCGP